MMVENGLTERHLVHRLRRLRCERPEYFHPERSFIFELQSLDENSNIALSI